MIKNVSHKDKEIRREINQAVGRPLSLLTRFKMGGNGSPRYTVREASPNIQTLLDKDNNTSVANIELRPEGVVLGFRSRLDSYAWVIPYHQLQVFKNAGLVSIYGGEEFMKLEIKDNFRDQGRFIRRLLHYKAQYSAGEAMPV